MVHPTQSHLGGYQPQTLARIDTIFTGHQKVPGWHASASDRATIIAGVKPADIPVEQPTDYAITLNLGTAHRLGIALPPALVARADATVE
jgi:hypothetical protein